MGLFNDIDPIFFYHKSVKPLLAMGFNGVVTPSGGQVVLGVGVDSQCGIAPAG
jgi:hypothetical protein